MASDHDSPAAEGRLSVTLERLAEKLNDLAPDRREAFRGVMESEAMEAPSEILKDVIRRRGLTAYRVGKNSGTSIDAVQRFLNGESGLRSDSFDKVCLALGLVLVEREPGPRRRARKRGANGHERTPDERAAGARGRAADRPDASREGSRERESGDLLPR